MIEQGALVKINNYLARVLECNYPKKRAKISFLHNSKDRMYKFDEMDDFKLSEKQRWELEKLWFIYGNHGPKSTDRNHKYIQRILDSNKDHRGFYRPLPELIKKVENILMDKENG